LAVVHRSRIGQEAQTAAKAATPLPSRWSARQWERLDAELRRGPLAWGYVEDQCWKLGRVKTLIGRLFHIGYTIEGVGKLPHRHGWSVQVPVRRAIERDEEAIAPRPDSPSTPR
jgi:transposase